MTEQTPLAHGSARGRHIVDLPESAIGRFAPAAAVTLLQCIGA